MAKKSDFLKQLLWALIGIGFITAEIGEKKKRGRNLTIKITMRKLA